MHKRQFEEMLRQLTNSNYTDVKHKEGFNKIQRRPRSANAWSVPGACPRREKDIYFKSHISLWEHSSHFKLIGRGLPSVVVSQ